jgi:DNA modification methylase/ParB-like chromosome segregation protein Spo0J
MKAHPYADIFPMLEGKELQSLANDIAENGLRCPILLYCGEILDGRNRFAACELAGVSPKFETFEGDDKAALNEAISLNLHRRHLDESQRAMVAARLATMKLGDNQHRSIDLPSVSQQDAADRLNVSTGSLKRAAVVLDRGTPELVRAADAGSIPVSGAAKLATTAPSTQADVLRRISAGTAKTVTTALNQIKREALVSATDAAPNANATILLADIRELDSIEPGSVDCIVTDPPYGLENHHSMLGHKRTDYSDGKAYALELLNALCERLVTICKSDAHLYFFSSCSIALEFRQILDKFFWVQVTPLIWLKNTHSAGIADDQQYHNNYDFIWFCKMPEGNKRKLLKFQTCVFPFNVDRESNHSAEKPVDLLKLLIEQSTQPGEHVFDPFCGSGSTGVAALELKRQFTGVEIDPKWAAVANARCRQVA